MVSDHERDCEGRNDIHSEGREGTMGSDHERDCEGRNDILPEGGEAAQWS